MAKRDIPKIAVKAREHVGTRYAIRERKAGRMPVVIYGQKAAPEFVTADTKEMTTLLHKHAHLVQVDVAGKTETCIVKDLQWDHLGSHIIHVDLARVDLNQKVKVSVDLEFFGEAPGLKGGGTFMEHSLNAIEVECIATDIPDSIRVDVSSLNVGEEITVGQIKLPQGVKTHLAADHVVAAIRVIIEEKLPDAPAATAEPEVIGKKVDPAAPAAAAGGKAPAGGAAKPAAKPAAKK